MKRIVLLVALVMVAGVSGFLWYSQHARQRALESGDVYVHNQTPGAPATPASSTPQETANTPADGQPASHSQPHGAIAIPASDTIQRNPPVGLAFAGSGKYQLYRQGDITWRLDTDTGIACIIFATDTQWSKVRVYASGCGVG